MSEPDWTNVNSVRVWLDKRYLVANNEMGSPYFQYLKDELVNGNKIRGREKYLSRSELLRWLLDTQSTRAFHYSADAMRTPYYPEYIDQLSQSRSQSPTQSGDRTRDEVSNSSSGNIPAERKSKQPKKRATTIPHNTKPARRSKSAKQTVLTSLGDGVNKKQSRRKAPLSAGNSKAAGTTKGVKQIDPEALRKQKARVSTLRPRSSCKRGKTGKKSCPLCPVNISNVYSI